MSTEDRSFDELVKESPKAPSADTVSLVGTLAKSDDPEKFVLLLADGNSLTLERSAVKKHAVLGHSVGYAIVQVEVDRAIADAAGKHMGGASYLLSINKYTSPLHDHLVTVPMKDEVPPMNSLPGLEHTAPGNGGDGGPYLSGRPGAAPFSLALQHHVAQAQLEALYYSGLGGMRTYFSLNWTTDHHPIFKVVADPMF